MAGDKVAAERGTERQRFLEVDAAPSTLETRGDAASFGRKVSREATAGERGDREANSLDADRVADGDAGQIETAAIDFQGVQAHDLPHRLHDPREHGAEGSAKARSNP